jgi:hypothetical protein
MRMVTPGEDAAGVSWAPARAFAARLFTLAVFGLHLAPLAFLADVLDLAPVAFLADVFDMVDSSA